MLRTNRLDTKPNTPVFDYRVLQGVHRHFFRLPMKVNGGCSPVGLQMPTIAPGIDASVMAWSIAASSRAASASGAATSALELTVPSVGAGGNAHPLIATAVVNSAAIARNIHDVTSGAHIK
jgi:hypothetical protein